MSYLQRRGKKFSLKCEGCGSRGNFTEYSGEKFCRDCGFVMPPEMVPAIEEDSEGNAVPRTADKGILGSKVDKHSHLLQRKHQKFDQSKPSGSLLEIDIKLIIEKIHGRNSIEIRNFEEVLKIKREYTKQFTEKKNRQEEMAMLQTNSLPSKNKRGEVITFLRPGGRDSGNHLSALVLTKHYSKLKNDWRADANETMQEVEKLVNTIELNDFQDLLNLTRERKNNILNDIKGLKKSWLFVVKNSSIKFPIPPILQRPDIRNKIVYVYREMFGSANSGFDNLIYKPNSEVWDSIKVPGNSNSLKSWIWELERLRKNINKSEMSGIHKLKRSIPLKLREEANDAFVLLEKYGGN